MIGAYFLSLVAVVFFTGCTTIQKVSVVDPGTESLRLEQAETRFVKSVATFTLPPGVYHPDFKTQNGVYYLASSKISIKEDLQPSPHEKSTGTSPIPVQVAAGGVFIPFKTASDQRHGVWIDSRQVQGDILSSPTRTFQFDEKLPLVPDDK